MPAVAPDVALLRNAIIAKLRSEEPPVTYQAIGDQLGMTRQSVRKVAHTYGLEPGVEPTRRNLSEDEMRVIQTAELHGIEPPVPIVGYQPRRVRR